MTGSYTAFAGRTGPFQATLPSTLTATSPISGHGSPEGVVHGVPGQRYTDIDTGDVYQKIQGTQKLGWALVGSVGGPNIAVIG